MKPGRIIGTAIVGFFFFLFIAVDLVLFGVIELNSSMVSLLPLIGLVLGGVLGGLASKHGATPAVAVAQPEMAVPQPVAPAAPVAPPAPQPPAGQGFEPPPPTT